MHDDDQRQLCAAAFKQQVEKMFDEAEKQALPALARGDTKVRTPIIGGFYDSWDEQRTEAAKRCACGALAARAQFKKDHPSWPELPVSRTELQDLQYGLSQRYGPREDADMQVFLMYALSQRYHHWDAGHPNFCDFVRSVMADKRAPDEIRNNEKLKKEFPPAPLVKLFNATDDPRLLYWCSPKMIASFKAEEAFRSARASGASREEAQAAGDRAYREILSIQ